MIPAAEVLRRAELAPLRTCRACDHHTGVECVKTIDTMWNCETDSWTKIGKDVGHYCLEFKKPVSGPTKVRCADCQAIHYHPGPPESLDCDHSLVVTMQSVTTANRCCALFASRHEVVV